MSDERQRRAARQAATDEDPESRGRALVEAARAGRFPMAHVQMGAALGDPAALAALGGADQAFDLRWRAAPWTRDGLLRVALAIARAVNREDTVRRPENHPDFLSVDRCLGALAVVLTAHPSLGVAPAPRPAQGTVGDQTMARVRGAVYDAACGRLPVWAAAPFVAWDRNASKGGTAASTWTVLDAVRAAVVAGMPWDDEWDRPMPLDQGARALAEARRLDVVLAFARVEVLPWLYRTGLDPLAAHAQDELAGRAERQRVLIDKHRRHARAFDWPSAAFGVVATDPPWSPSEWGGT